MAPHPGHLAHKSGMELFQEKKLPAHSTRPTAVSLKGIPCLLSRAHGHVPKPPSSHFPLESPDEPGAADADRSGRPASPDRCRALRELRRPSERVPGKP